jgi:hypothetical protein
MYLLRMPAEHSRGAIPFYLVREPIKGSSEYGRVTGGILGHRILGGAMRATIEEHKLFVSLAEYKLRLVQEYMSHTSVLKQSEVANAFAVPSHLSVCRALRRRST